MHYVNQSVHNLSHYSTVESVYWQLHKKGVGSVVKHAFAITDKEGTTFGNLELLVVFSYRRTVHLNGIKEVFPADPERGSLEVC